jgi:predicted transcriptional regulator
MEIKKVNVGIKSLETALGDFVETGRAIQNETAETEEKGVYFTSVEAFRKALTPKRLALLKAIKAERPSSLRQLSKITGRDVKNVSMDVKFLEQVGLVEFKPTGGKEKGTALLVDYDKILFEIAV